MRTLTKILATTAVAFSLASAAQAATVLDFGDAARGAALTWASSGTGGTLSTVQVGGLDPVVTLTVLDSLLTGFVPDTAIQTYFHLDASDATNATIDNGQLSQWNVGGSFSFLSVNAFVYDGHNYGAGTNVISATFTNAELHGRNNNGGFDATDGSVNSQGDVTHVTYTSAILTSVGAFKDSGFSFSDSATNPAYGAAGCTNASPEGTHCTSSLTPFTTNNKGTLNAAIPEPASWSLMIMGFGGIGAALRRRRTMVAGLAA
jgi:hypothetical protein